MKNLTLPLTTQWFHLTRDQIKTEDYRDITAYWFKRLVFDPKNAVEFFGYKYKTLTDQQVVDIVTDKRKLNIIAFRPFQQNIMTLGYPAKHDTARKLKIDHNGIEIGPGRIEWGAEEKKLYFIIKHKF